ncbi:hypothetical protein ACP70R_027195 [Stipagrostis hirtigluma subsp. patula]
MSDDVVWHCIRHGHCSFMAKYGGGKRRVFSIETAIFCRNPYNVTGICNRSSCPLANSRYATIRDHDGIFYLYMKTAERVHLPNKLWERVKLPRNYEKAIEVIDKHLEFWPKLLVHKIKQRLTKMTQCRIRMRKLDLKVREKIVTLPRKKTQHDVKKMKDAGIAAQIETYIQRELIERLKSGCYPRMDPICDIDDEQESTDVPCVIEYEKEGMSEYVVGDDVDMEMDDMEDFEGLPNSEDGNIAEDLLYEPVARKRKGPGSYSKSMVGKRSMKIITELEQVVGTHCRKKTQV